MQPAHSRDHLRQHLRHAVDVAHGGVVAEREAQQAQREFARDAQGEKDAALGAYVQALGVYWTAYYRLRRLTLYDFAAGRDIASSPSPSASPERPQQP